MNTEQTELERFICDGKFVNPEKVEAYYLYGLKKAKELWQDGEPAWSVRSFLQKSALNRYLTTSLPIRCNFIPGLEGNHGRTGI